MKTNKTIGTEKGSISDQAALVNVEKNLNGAIKIDAAQIHSHLDLMVRSTVEETLNQLLDKEADQLHNAKRYELSVGRTNGRAGHYLRSFHTKAHEVELQIPKLRYANLVAVVVGEDGYRDILGAAEGCKKDKAYQQFWPDSCNDAYGGSLALTIPFKPPLVVADTGTL